MIIPEYCPKRQPSFPTWPFGKKRRVVALSITLIASSCITFIIGASGLRVKPLSLQAATSPAPANLIFAIEVINADPMSRTITMDWYPQLASRCRTSDSSEVMDIFVNPGSLDSSSPSFTSSPPYQPVFQYNRTMQCSQSDPLNASFRTVTKLLVSRPFATTAIAPLASSSTLQNYPFDQYTAQFIVYALDHDTGVTVPLNISNSFGIAVNFELKLTTTTSYDFPNSRLYFSLTLQRSRAMKIFVLLIAVINWLIAATFLAVCASTVIYPSHAIYAELFVVPVGAVFALTSVRANLPGAPVGFGAAIDLYSILPVLVVTGLSGSYLILVILFRRLVERDHFKNSDYLV